MTIELYPPRLSPNIGIPDSPAPKRLSRYGADKPAPSIRYKAKCYMSSCPHCLNGTVRLEWEPGANAHSLTCLMCAWSYHQDPRTVAHHA